MDWPKAVRLYLTQTIKLCRLNPAGGFGPRTDSARLPIWSLLAELFFVYFSLKLLACQLLQHHYDVLQHVMGQQKRKTGSGNPTATTSTNTTLQVDIELELELKRATERINWLGNSYYEFGFTVEPVYLYTLVIVFLICVGTRVHFELRPAPPSGALQMLLDPKRARCQVTEREIERQLQQFAESSLQFMFARRAEIFARSSCQPRTRAATIGSRPGRDLLGVRGHLEARELEWAHECAVDVAQQLAREGSLVPPNRQARALQKLARAYGVMTLWSDLWALGFVLATMFVVPWSGLIGAGCSPRVSPWPHLLFQAELVCHSLIILQHLTFYMVNSFQASYEQLMFVRELRRQVASLIRDTCLCLSPTNTNKNNNNSNNNNNGDLTRRLTRALILYKLLLRQLRASQPWVGFAGAQLTLLMLVVPVMNRLYVAYLPQQIQWAMIVAALAVLAACDLLLMPHCMLYARCLDLFRSMSHLLAHIDAHQAAQGARLSVFDPHTVWLLRREQNEPEAALRRFATNAFLLRLTYASFLENHFWCALLLTPMLLLSNPARQLGASGNLLTDSLRLL